MNELFSSENPSSTQQQTKIQPLAERVRPNTRTQFIGEATLLEQIFRNTTISMIFWGPPGCGKTTLARIYAVHQESRFVGTSAIIIGVKELRQLMNEAQLHFQQGKQTILFIDEIHHFNKSQQDVLLKSVEEGVIQLIGATTENPSFSLNNALLSRCRVFHFAALPKQGLEQILDQALQTDPILQQQSISFKDHARQHLINVSDGDARRMLNLLEAVVGNSSECQITVQDIEAAYQQKTLLYDRSGDFHYDVISAFIKSIRGSDPDAALYYLAIMLESGEDIRFIARRMVILASEDVGNAYPLALSIASACMTAVAQIGMPEARIILGQTATFLASCPKSNRAYLGINKAQEWVKREGVEPVPLHLRNAPTSMMKELGYGATYKYPHDFEGHFTVQQYLPESFKHQIFYHPSTNGMEARFLTYLKEKWGEEKPY